MKPMLSTKELIEHMKEKGITFRETSEKEAMDFLENNNYYMKLAAYRANYEKCAEGKRKGIGWSSLSLWRDFYLPASVMRSEKN